MEHINNENINHGTMHWDNNGHVSSGGTVNCDVQQYHIYSIEWDDQSIVWLLDGIKYLEGNISNNINSTEEFHKPFYMIFNLAIGGSWPGNPDSTTLFPDTMSVDYVRVYQKSTTSLTDVFNEKSIKISPNPTSDMLTIEIPQIKGKSILSISDLSGKELISRRINDQKNQISLLGLSNGVYILKYSNDLFTLNEKIIKK
jgi:beta-glucanase (GH16 family)